MDRAGTTLAVRRTWRRWLVIGMVLWALATALTPAFHPPSHATTPTLAGPIDGGNG